MTAQSLKTPKSCFSIHCCLLAVMMCVTSGCTVIKYGTQTLITEPARFAVNVDRHRTEKSNKELAENAWVRCMAANAGPFSDHYHQGFVCGFAENLEYGGNVAPPLVPPREYWKRRYRTPEGRAAIQDWFAGHTAGFESAHDGVPRQLTAVASSLTGPSVRFDRANPTPLEQPLSPAAPSGEFESIPENNQLLPETDQRPRIPNDVLPEQQQIPQSLEAPAASAESFTHAAAGTSNSQFIPEAEASQKVTLTTTRNSGDPSNGKTYATIRETVKPTESSGLLWKPATKPSSTSEDELPSSPEPTQPPTTDESETSQTRSVEFNYPNSFAAGPVLDELTEATDHPHEIQSFYKEDTDTRAGISLRSYHGTLTPSPLPANLQQPVHQQHEDPASIILPADSVIQIPGSEELDRLPSAADGPGDEETSLPGQETVDLPPTEPVNSDLLPNLYFPADSAVKP